MWMLRLRRQKLLNFMPPLISILIVPSLVTSILLVSPTQAMNASLSSKFMADFLKQKSNLQQMKRIGCSSTVTSRTAAFTSCSSSFAPMRTTVKQATRVGNNVLYDNSGRKRFLFTSTINKKTLQISTSSSRSCYNNNSCLLHCYMSTSGRISGSSSSSTTTSIRGNNQQHQDMDPTCTASPPLSSSLSLPYYWERLGYPKTVMAPMVAQSDLAFRKLCRAHGTQLCFTQMIHAHNFVSSESFQLNHLDVYPWGQESYVAPSGFRALKGCLSPLLDGNELAKGLDDASTNENVYDNDDEMDEDDSGGGYHDHDLDSMEYSTLSSTNQYKSGTIYDEGPIGTTASRITIDHEKNVWDGRKVDNHQHQDNTNHDQASQSHDVTVPIIHHSHPLIVQIAGNDPQTMSNAAKIILERTNHPQAAAKGWYHGPVAGIDVNCGCPQAIAKKGRYGAFLMEESEDLVCEIISTLRRDLPFNVGVSCKIRLPLQEDKLKERICKLIDAGVDLISVHGRTLKENKTKVRECNWDAIAKVVQIAKEYSQNPYFPIIANGGIEYSSDVDRCLAYTGASAVMSSEALLENPGIFQQSAKDDVDISPELLFQRQIRYCHEYLDLCTLYPPLPGSLGKIGGSFNCIRAHFFKIVHRYLEEHPDLRELLGHPTKVTSIGGARQLLYQLEQRYSNITDWSELRSSNVSKSSWYRRHREAAVTSRMSTRGQRVESELAGLSIEEKKNVMRERLRKLREQRLTQTN